MRGHLHHIDRKLHWILLTGLAIRDKAKSGKLSYVKNMARKIGD